MKNEKKGFTLLEILLVVAAIAILAGIVILAINPAKQLGDTKDAARRADVNTILNAVYQYAIDNNGAIPATISSTTTEICMTGGTCDGLIDLSALTKDEKYLVSIPVDSSTNENGTGYEIVKTANNRITVEAMNASTGTIKATR